MKMQKDSFYEAKLITASLLKHYPVVLIMPSVWPTLKIQMILMNFSYMHYRYIPRTHGWLMWHLYEFASYRCHLKHPSCIWRVVWASIKSLMCLAVSFDWFLGLLSSFGFLCRKRMRCKKVSDWLKWKHVFVCVCVRVHACMMNHLGDALVFFLL